MGTEIGARGYWDAIEDVKVKVMDHKKFWLVWNPGRVLPKGQCRHNSCAAAEAEATRLARKHPGEDFFICEAGKVVASPDPVKVTNLV